MRRFWDIEFINRIEPDRVYKLSVMTFNNDDPIESLHQHIKDYIKNSEIVEILSLTQRSCN